VFNKIEKHNTAIARLMFVSVLSLAFSFGCYKNDPRDESTVDELEALELLEKSHKLLYPEDKRTIDPNAAITLLAKASTVKPQSPSILAMVYSAMGNAYYELDEDSSAIYYIRKALSYSRDRASDYFQLGEIYMYHDEYKDAIIEFQNAIIYGDLTWDRSSYENIASCYMRIHDYENAVNWFNDFIEIAEPDEKSAHYDLAICYLHLNQLKEAEAQHEILKQQNATYLVKKLREEIDSYIKLAN
jgi:tetratricopeptide (TPR) repeat protein